MPAIPNVARFRSEQADREEAMKPQFVRLEMPRHVLRGKSGSVHFQSMEKLEVGGDAYFVPASESETRAISALMCRTARNVMKKTGRKFAVRTCKLGVQLGVGVWRIA